MKLRRRTFLAPILTSLAAVALAPPSDAGAKGGDPAARGLDLFLDAPSVSAPGATIPLQIQALGFPTALALAPLSGATIDASWDPESLGPNVSSVPKTVTVTTDAAGRAHVDVPVPVGDERELKLLVGLTLGDHHRVVETRVRRVASREVSLVVPDARVVPGGATSAWALVSDTTTGAPAAGETVVFELLEGGVARQTVRTVTDLAGTATARVAIPWTDDPSLTWKLSARARSAADFETGAMDIKLSPREETPGEPQLSAEWATSHVLPGDKIAFTVRARDASDRPLAGASVRYWIGPKGTEPPVPTIDPKGWERVSTLATTDAAGEIKGTTDAPKNVRRGTSTSLRIVALAEVFGHGLRAENHVEVSLPSPVALAYPEVHAVVPGVEQSLVVRVLDPRDKPVQGTFTVEGDGLSERVTTDALGQAEVKWKAPRDVGATRNLGPCAGGVAATVWLRPVAPIAALDNRTEPFSTCVPVDREIKGIARADGTMATAGGKLTVRVEAAAEEAAKGKAKAPKADEKAGSGAWSVLVKPASQLASRAASTWLEGDGKPVEIALPSVTPGAWSISAQAPSFDHAARTAMGRVLVAPRVVPKIVGKVTGGRAAPLGTVEVDVDLTDGKGAPAPGSVAAMLVDAFGGAETRGLTRLDTRGRLCRTLDVEDEACDAFFDDPKADVLRRRVLGAQDIERAWPTHDPAGTAKEDLRQAFKRVLMSLEGAVMEAAATPDTLRDVFRKDKGGAYAFNPELFTLVTAAMDPPPETPGGEPILLADLVSLDKQVTFDNVARRVTRLRMFRVLSAVRNYRRNHSLMDPDEPALRDPNALVRRAIASGEMQAQDLVDPWGGTMTFVKAQGARLPFVTVHGFELHAPGPDGKPGTADDVKSPFQRVLASKTPYAEALDEDRVVDAELDMEVSDTTVDAWQGLLEELTGQQLGIGLGTISTMGHGEGGGGFGQGFGAGGIGMISRKSSGISTGAAYFAPPARTDDKGHIHLRVPLGDVETTWRLVLVGAPDGATPAVTTVDIPSALPLSARVDAGSAWIQGDQGDVIVTVRNRTAAAAKVELTMTAGGVAEIASASDRSRSVDVPAGGAAPVTVRLRSKGVGTASLDVVAKGPGGLEDRTTHTWEVRPAGDAVDLTSTQWVTGKATLALTQVGPGLVATGTPRLTLERGNAQAVEAALGALDPDTIGSLDGLSYAAEAAGRVREWAIAQRGENDPLAVRAGDVTRRAVGRLLARIDSLHEGPPNAVAMRLNSSGVWSAQRRALRWAPVDLVKSVAKVDDCPPELPSYIDGQLAILEAEPSSADGVVQACWDSAVTTIVESVITSTSPASLARAVIALAERPHRAAMAATLANNLRAWTSLRPSGAVTLPASSSDRASRALVFAALLRTASFGKAIATTPDKLAAWLRVQRDVRGGYGSTLATLAAVRALVSQPAESKEPTKITITEDGVAKEVTVAAGQTLTVPLGVKTLAIDLDAAGPGVVARLSRPGLRLWSSPPDTSSSPIALDVQWPDKPKVNVKQVLRVVATSRGGRPLTADVRIPLPPGVALAEGVARVHQMNGQLLIRTNLDADGTNAILELPIRFGLAGTFTVPEAKARSGELAETIVAARPIAVSQ
ncbi:MAG: hypothetical protein U0441_01335 [Polyangiaceae bacterium]